MSYRFMRLIVFFDLPVKTMEDKRNYRHFRKDLIRLGFYMIQESVYCRILLNQTALRAATEQIRKIKPPAGLVMLLPVTEKQFAGMEYIVGEAKNDVLDTDERIVVL